MKNSNSINVDKYHEPVMVSEVIESLHLNNKSKHFNKFSKIIDATLGTGGHTQALVDAGGQVLGIEMDPKMLSVAKERLGSKATLVKGNFSEIEEIAKSNDFSKVDGVLLDLGVSNIHLKQDDRGFSFSNKDQVLDMRLDSEKQGVTASDLVNALDATQLTNLFAVVMSFNSSRKLAKKIVNNRPIKTVGDLVEISAEFKKNETLHPATLPMLALRIAVNSELENLKKVLPKAYNLLSEGGKLLVITFHSGEVDILKKYCRSANLQSDLVLPGEIEVERNPRSRSAKLWIITKIKKI